jgi:hypothetical protein
MSPVHAGTMGTIPIAQSVKRFAPELVVACKRALQLLPSRKEKQAALFGFAQQDR